MDIRSVVKKCLKESGIHIFIEDIENVNLLDYEMDSLMFVSFIMALEENLSINIPDEYLYIDVLQSLGGFIALLEQLVEEQAVLA